MSIRVNITIDIDQELTEQESNIISALSGQSWPSPAAVERGVEKRAKHEEKATKPAPKKAEKAEKAEPKKDESTAEEPASLDAAVKRATKLVSEGKSSLVKQALSDVGAKRVSELDSASVEKFMNALGEEK